MRAANLGHVDFVVCSTVVVWPGRGVLMVVWFQGCCVLPDVELNEIQWGSIHAHSRPLTHTYAHRVVLNNVPGILQIIQSDLIRQP